jgi:hypothetical protein
MLPGPAGIYAFTILNYLKPLFARPILHITAVRYFDDGSGNGIKRLFRGLGASLVRGLPGDLLWRRLSPWRSVMMPVRVLENLKPRRVRQRKKTLLNGGIDFCVFLTIWGSILNIALSLGELLFFAVMVQMFRPDYYVSFSVFLNRFELPFYTIMCINYILVESIYVCMGFSLYLNSRVEVEGWDLEILLRDLASRRKNVSGLPKAAGMALVLLVLSLMFIVPSVSYAENGSGQGISDQSVNADDAIPPGEQGTVFEKNSNPPLEDLERVFASKDFGGEKESWGIRQKNPQEKKEGHEPELAPWVEKIRLVFAYILRALLVLAMAFAAIFAFLYLRRMLPGKNSIGNRKHEQSVLIRPDADPQKLFSRSLAFYEQGNIRSAWASCFAGLAAAMIRYQGIVLPAGATEYDCLVQVRRWAAAAPSAVFAPELCDNFAAFIRDWIGLAYGGIMPAEGAFERAVQFGLSLKDFNPGPGDTPNNLQASGGAA